MPLHRKTWVANVEAGCSPNLAGFNAAISACQDGEWQVALALLKDMTNMELMPFSSSCLVETCSIWLHILTIHMQADMMIVDATSLLNY